jgi:hypothetical protein
MGPELPNNALELSVSLRGRPVLAMNCALAGAQQRQWSAAQQDR